MSLAAKDRHALSASVIDEAVHQAGLADARLPLDHERRRPPLAALADGSGNHGELSLSPHQAVRRSHPQSLHHANTSIDRVRQPVRAGSFTRFSAEDDQRMVGVALHGMG